MSDPTITIVPDQQVEQLKDIKQRQKQRVQQGKTKYTVDEIGGMLSDILENQARAENERAKILALLSPTR